MQMVILTLEQKASSILRAQCDLPKSWTFFRLVVAAEQESGCTRALSMLVMTVLVTAPKILA